MISMVIPMYNAEKTILACLEPLLKQNAEIIVVDDGSIDNSINIIKKFKKVKLIQQEHKGPAEARNLGVKKARNKIVLFLDGDVILKTEDLNIILKKFRENKSLLAIQGVYTKFGYHKNLSSLYKDLYYYHFFKDISENMFPPISTHCLAVRKDSFLKLEGFDANINTASIEDAEFGLKLKNLNKKSTMLDKSLKVQHMKKYDLRSLIKTDYKMGFNKIKSLLRTGEKEKIVNIASTQKQTVLFMMSIIFSIMTALNFIFFIFTGMPFFFIASLIIYLIINASLFKTFLKEAKLKSVFLLILNFISNFFVAIAIIHGIFDMLVFRRKY